MKGKTRGLYAGSFDPITKGHIDIIEKACMTFDEVYVSIGQNPKKTRTCPLEESKQLILDSIIIDKASQICTDAYYESRLHITDYVGISIVKYAHNIDATHIIRGLRQAGDFNDEFALTGTAGRLDSEVIFTHFICKEKYLHVSSSTAKELAFLNEDISWLVTPVVGEALLKAYNKM